MKTSLSLVSAFSALFLSSIAAGKIQEVENFLSQEEAHTMLKNAQDLGDQSFRENLKTAHRFTLSELDGSKAHNLLDHFALSPEDDSSLRLNLGLNVLDSPPSQNQTMPIKIKSMYETSEVHTDCLVELPEQPCLGDGDLTAFIFLNSNPKAVFQVSGETIPVEAGKLVVFPGNQPHNTIIDDGIVHIAGAFHAGSFEQVGILYVGVLYVGIL